jgi:hypothetical protein
VVAPSFCDVLSVDVFLSAAFDFITELLSTRNSERLTIKGKNSENDEPLRAAVHGMPVW